MRIIARRITSAAVAAGLFSAAMLTGSAAAHADPDAALGISTLAAPIWLTDTAMRVEYVVSNPGSQLFCESTHVRLTWASSGGHWHHEYENAATTLGVATGSFAIPGGTIWPGTLRYQVSASQSCGLAIGHSFTYRGVSPHNGFSTATIK
jgi:hypothetical protein